MAQLAKSEPEMLAKFVIIWYNIMDYKILEDIMINKDKLKSILDGYIAYFPKAWEKGEMEKWQAIKCFQDNWDIDAENFEVMFANATHHAAFLLSAMNFYPRKMILNFAKADAEATRSMFRKLYDESLPLKDRVNAFQTESEALRAKYDDDGTWKNHYQKTNAISTYLWLKYPDKYYIYKYELAHAAALELSSDHQPKANGSAESMIAGFNLYDDICEVVKADTRIRDMINRNKTDSCYDDPEMKTATIDVVFYLKRFILDEKEKADGFSWFPSHEEYDPELSVDDWLELFKDKSVLTDDSFTILSRMLEMGGAATCKELSDKYGKSPNYYNSGSTSLAKRVHDKTNCPIMPRDEDNARWWPILYVGRHQASDKPGEYVWKMREELKEALETIDTNVVNTWLLNWNPSNQDWKWEEQEDEYGYKNTVKTVKSGGTVFFCWKCMSKQIKTGDRIFMVKLGNPPRGIFATGYAASDTYDSTYTDDNGKEATERVVDICITGFLDYHTDKLISQDILKSKFPDQQWSPQGSGISIKPEAARWLIEKWNNFNDDTNDVATDDVSSFHSDARHKQYFIPITEALIQLGGSAKRTAVHKKVAEICGITDEELSVKNKSNQSVVKNDIDWARNYLNYEGFIDSNAPNGIWALSDIGKKYEMTEELAEKIIVKWVKITTARRKNDPEPVIDLTPYYKLRKTKYTKQDFINDVYMIPERYDELKALLINKQNIILQGAPGVGKTYSAERLAYSIMGEKDDSRIEFIQFHQNYSYEDFIMGYRPNEKGGFDLKEGVFYRFCEKARNDPDHRKHFFIIDEINRGNLSKIFGELLMLIEKDYRKESATLAYRDEKFTVPDNLYIIGMMNTADRSLALIDYALRRRFSFFEMEPGFDSDGFRKYAAGLNNPKVDELIKKIVELNKAITDDKSLGKGFRIGHSYFCGRSAENCTDEWLRSVVKYDIIPTLEEYWFDDMDKVSDWENKLNGALND